MIATQDGTFIGKSRTAGFNAVSQCIIGRVIAAAPILLIPPLVMHRLEQKPWLIRRPYLAHPLMMGLIGLMLQVRAVLTNLLKSPS